MVKQHKESLLWSYRLTELKVSDYLFIGPLNLEVVLWISSLDMYIYGIELKTKPKLGKLIRRHYSSGNTYRWYDNDILKVSFDRNLNLKYPIHNPEYYRV